MTVILFFTVLGFMIGLTGIMVKRKIEPGKLLTAFFLGILTTGAWALLNKHRKRNKWNW